MLPTVDSDKYEEMLLDLELNLQTLHLISFVICLISFEEIYLK